ncbi:lysM domain receptor-like kinase 3 [Magnolia sinica]|uniref:lysM domain receptor-like kinase 3 n=1 Tax=Magnolia sinica TaxID=86752 RepID=UPI002659EBD0|nr:lysM domain receptor-like kinase 3 [Magnolia sinica]
MAQITSLHLLLILLPTTLFTISHSNLSIKASLMYPFTCAQDSIQTCNASLYHISTGLKIEELATFYNTNTSQITPISHATNQDYLISVPCTCRDMNGTFGYFYDSTYNVSMGDTSTNVMDRIYNGQAWNGGDDGKLLVGNVVPIHLLCGCSNSPTVVTYTVQEQDTLAGIAELLSSSVDGIESLNGRMTQNPGFIDVGWVLFVPMEKVGVVTPKEGKRSNTPIIIGVVASVSVFLVAAGVAVVCFIRRNTSRQTVVQDPKIMGKTLSAKNMVSLHNQYLQRENMKDAAVFESERPVTFSLEEVEEATGNFDETRKIGEGGYGSVYFGILEAQELAIKKMKSSKSKEFFAELKVLCKVHHINVVELIGYACGEDHLYLVYEFVRNGSLNDHLHDPLLKGHQPLSWNARAQIALDAARGIEYIHDHTKAQYVHRDIKTSNILLDEGLRAKVGDFGLAKLVERSSEEDCFVTHLVGTPGYLPPESVRELQMTSKTDVFAFGVVLAELITGQRALIRDNREPNRMKSLTSIVYEIFRKEEPENALEAVIDGNLKDSYPIEEVYKMAEIAGWCLNEEPVNRPEMRDIVVMLSQIMVASVEWEASLGGKSQVFSGILNGR